MFRGKDPGMDMRLRQAAKARSCPSGSFRTSNQVSLPQIRFRGTTPTKAPMIKHTVTSPTSLLEHSPLSFTSLPSWHGSPVTPLPPFLPSSSQLHSACRPKPFLSPASPTFSHYLNDLIQHSCNRANLKPTHPANNFRCLLQQLHLKGLFTPPP